MFIYFIQSVNGGPIKIGKADNPQVRLKMLQSANPETLDIIGLAQGGVVQERMLHKHFDNARIQGEWFNPSLELLAFVSKLPNLKESLNGKPIPFLNKMKTPIVELRKAGYTLQQIGQLFGFTRERARQILLKEGFTGNIPQPCPVNLPPIEEYYASNFNEKVDLSLTMPWSNENPIKNIKSDYLFIREGINNTSRIIPYSFIEKQALVPEGTISKLIKHPNGKKEKEYVIKLVNWFREVSPKERLARYFAERDA